MTEEWGQRNNAPILRPGWGLGLNRPSFWQKDGVRKILQPLTGIFCPHFFAKLPWVISAFLPGLCGVKGWGACTEGCTAETGHHAEVGESMNLFCTTLGPEIMGSRPPSLRKKRHPFSGNSPTQNNSPLCGGGGILTRSRTGDCADHYVRTPLVTPPELIGARDGREST